MKLGKIILTKTEKENITKYLDIDPCGNFECREIDCGDCPFRKIVEELENVRSNFRAIIDKETMVGEND